MAFVKLEDKTTEVEIVVFPNLYEQVGAKLVQDAVIRITGKVNARDRDGNLRSEASVIADEIIEITDEELRTYESTGRKMEAPRMSAKVKATRVAAYKAAKNGSTPVPLSKPETQATEKESPPARPIVIEKPVLRQIFVHVKNTDDHASLQSLRQLCTKYPGIDSVVLVLGEDKKSAIKLPFGVEAGDALVSEFVKLLGEDCVVLK
jgi:DNA polymerase-3 subunit alpha